MCSREGEKEVLQVLSRYLTVMMSQEGSLTSFFVKSTFLFCLVDSIHPFPIFSQNVYFVMLIKKGFHGGKKTKIGEEKEFCRLSQDSSFLFPPFFQLGSRDNGMSNVRRSNFVLGGSLTLRDRVRGNG